MDVSMPLIFPFCENRPLHLNNILPQSRNILPVWISDFKVLILQTEQTVSQRELQSYSHNICIWFSSQIIFLYDFWKRHDKF
jgi:hypothetical protein